MINFKTNEKWDQFKVSTSEHIYSRFRLTTISSEIANPTDVASDGEVEDYLLVVSNFSSFRYKRIR